MSASDRKVLGLILEAIETEVDRQSNDFPGFDEPTRERIMDRIVEIVVSTGPVLPDLSPEKRAALLEVLERSRGTHRAIILEKVPPIESPAELGARLAFETAEAVRLEIRNDFQREHPHYTPPPEFPSSELGGVWGRWRRANLRLHGREGCEARFPHFGW